MRTDEHFGYRCAGSPLEAERCLQCHEAPCTKGCPAGVDVKRFIGLMQKGDYGAAAEVIERDNPLGLICGYTCPTAETCQKNCVSAKLGRPIDIRALQSYTIELSRAMGDGARRGTVNANEEIRFNRGGVIETKKAVAGGYGRVAVVGSGPAGLSAAWYLNMLGYAVELIEAADCLGGRMVQGIPPFRVEPDMIRGEIENMTQGMDVRLGKRLGQDFTVQELLEQGFRGVVLALGKYRSKGLQLEGCAPDACYDAAQILNGTEWQAKGHREAVVIGAGNVAMDAARTLMRAGVEKVHLCYRGGNQQVKALQEEREAAYQDGITLHLFAVPKAVETRDGRMIGVTFHRSALLQTEGGKAALSVLGREYDFTIPADMLVMAVGFGVREEDIAGSAVEFADETVRYATNIPGVYAAGDLIGGNTIVEGVADGKGAAFALHEYLMKGAGK